ncbi:MAG: PQQ-like beta-propeller repeat protein, partial [Candidatus Latescibacteria bacterium]|nr:PQQ-like beta-propeller repeat protein [Candidatus Latescibacterota bacterium]
MKKSTLLMRRFFPALFLCVFFVAPAVVSGDDVDWPMWRHDSAHTASTPHNLPDELYPLWMRQYSPRKPAWDDPLNRDLMHFDRIFEPIVADGMLVFGFNDSDKIVALDTDTGKEKWTFYTDGPVRLPPAAWNGKVYATSDDGFLYCLDLRKGSLVWKFRGGPSDRRVLGNGRLVSMWPARGGVAIEDGVVYFAASIWPFMGIFIYALDAETGGIVWVNDGEGSRFMRQPHNAPSFAGVAPQGSMTVEGDRLLISGGRSVPACFDRRTGEFRYYELASSGKTGGSFVAASGDYFFNHYRERVTSLFYGPSGNMLAPGIGKYPVLDGDAWYFSGETVTGFDAAVFDRSFKEWLNSAGEPDAGELRKQASSLVRENIRWEIDVNADGDLIRAGKRLYAAGGGVIT